MLGKTLTLAVIAAVAAARDYSYPCDTNDKKFCPVDQICKKGFYWDHDACNCFSLRLCKIMCPTGQGLDPRYSCECVDQSVIDALYTCPPDEPRIDLSQGWVYATPQEVEIAIVEQEAQQVEKTITLDTQVTTVAEPICLTCPESTTTETQLADSVEPVCLTCPETATSEPLKVESTTTECLTCPETTALETQVTAVAEPICLTCPETATTEPVKVESTTTECLTCPETTVSEPQVIKSSEPVCLTCPESTVEPQLLEVAMEEPLMPVVEEICTLTVYDCPTLGFSVDYDRCECVCTKVCDSLSSLDSRTCSCLAIQQETTFDDYRTRRRNKRTYYDVYANYY